MSGSEFGVGRRVAVAGAALFVALAPVSGLAAEDQKAILKIVDPVYNFGTVAQGSKVVHDFTIKNTGNANLQIQQVIPSCGCTASAASTDLVAPGAQATVHVEFDTTGFSGHKMKTVRLTTSDVDNAAPTLTITGEIETEVKLEPETVSFGEGARGEMKPQQVTISVDPKSKMTIGDIKTYSKYLDVQKLETTDKLAKVRVALKPETPVGYLRDRLVVEMKDGATNMVNVPVLATVKGDLKLEPPVVSFGLIEGKDAITRSIKLENTGPENLVIKSIDSSESGVKVSYDPIKEGRIYVIHVSVDPQKVVTDLRANINIETNNKEQQELTLSVYGILPPKT